MTASGVGSSIRARMRTRAEKARSRGRAAGGKTPRKALELRVRRLFAESVRAKLGFLRQHSGDLVQVAERVAEAIRGGGKLLLFGNGGSAADAQHIAAELVGRLQDNRAPLPALALTTDTSALTAIGNDFGQREIFARQVRALGRRGDVALALSTSGNSPNVLRAVAACRAAGITTVALTGRGGGRLRGGVDYLLVVPGRHPSARIQETHILAGHVLCDLVERLLAVSGACAGRRGRHPA